MRMLKHICTAANAFGRSFNGKVRWWDSYRFAGTSCNGQSQQLMASTRDGPSISIMIKNSADGDCQMVALHGWTMVVKRSNDRLCKNGHIMHQAPEWMVQFFRGSEDQASWPTRASGLDTTGWQLTELHCLPTKLGPGQWIVYVIKSPKVFGMSRTCLTCHDLTIKQEHRLYDHEGQAFELALGKSASTGSCKAAARSHSDCHVDIYDLPGLGKLILIQAGAQAGNCSSC